MPTLVPVVEGDGEKEAVPLLLRRMLEHHELWNWQIGKARQIGGIGTLRKNLASILKRLVLDPSCDAILILNDLDDGCPAREAYSLAQQARDLVLPCPVAIVLAHREYEAWFLASLPSIAGHFDLPQGLTYSGNVEERRDAKGWLSDHMPRGKIYKETSHQVRMTHLLDINQTLVASRSFRRLNHAIEELLIAYDTGRRGVVTPPGLDPPQNEWDVEDYAGPHIANVKDIDWDDQ